MLKNFLENVVSMFSSTAADAEAQAEARVLAAAEKAAAKAKTEAATTISATVGLWLPASVMNNRAGSGSNAIVYAVFDLLDAEQRTLFANGLQGSFPLNIATAMTKAPFVSARTYLLSNGADEAAISEKLAAAQERGDAYAMQRKAMTDRHADSELVLADQKRERAILERGLRTNVGLNGEDPNAYVTTVTYVAVVGEVTMSTKKIWDKELQIHTDIIELTMVNLDSVDTEHPMINREINLDTFVTREPKRRTPGEAAGTKAAPNVTVSEAEIQMGGGSDI